MPAVEMRAVARLGRRRAAGALLVCAAWAAIFKPSAATADEPESHSVLMGVTARVVRPVVIKYELDALGNPTVNISNSDGTNITTSMRAAEDGADEHRYEILVVTVEY